jgi:hypothetical protein
MGDIHYVREIPEGTMLVARKEVLLFESTFNRIGDYTRSKPTAPSPGVIYRKALHWTALWEGHEGEDPNWWVYITIVCPGGHKNHKDGCIEHTPRRPVILEGV